MPTVPFVFAFYPQMLDCTSEGELSWDLLEKGIFSCVMWGRPYQRKRRNRFLFVTNLSVDVLYILTSSFKVDSCFGTEWRSAPIHVRSFLTIYQLNQVSSNFLLFPESRSREESQKIEQFQQQQQQHQQQQQQQQQQAEHLLMEQLQLSKHYPITSNCAPPHGLPHQHAHMQFAFPPGYDQFQPQQRFNYNPPSVRPTQSMVDSQQPNHFQAFDFVSNVPQSVGHIAPGSVQPGPSFPMMYPETPAYFFYQQWVSKSGFAVDWMIVYL